MQNALNSASNVQTNTLNDFNSLFLLLKALKTDYFNGGYPYGSTIYDITWALWGYIAGIPGGAVIPILGGYMTAERAIKILLNYN